MHMDEDDAVLMEVWQTAVIVIKRVRGLLWQAKMLLTMQDKYDTLETSKGAFVEKAERRECPSTLPDLDNANVGMLIIAFGASHRK